jgi:transposase-like protein
MPDQLKLTETVFRRLVESARKGSTYKQAARRAGIGQRTLRRWLRMGRRNEDEGCVALLAAMEQAEAERSEEWLDCVNTAAKDDWKAAIELLSRRFPQEWASDKQRMKHIERRIAELEKQQGKPDA